MLLQMASLLGDVRANGIKVENQKGSLLSGQNVVFHSETETISGGKVKADKVFSATSDGRSLEKARADAQAGELVNYQGREFEKKMAPKRAHRLFVAMVMMQTS